VLSNVCRALEAVGLSVVVVVALEATPAPATNGHALRRARRSLETGGLSVVAALADDAVAPAPRRPHKTNLALVREETERLGFDARSVAQGGVNAGPVIVLTTAVDEATARAAFVTGGLGYLVKARDAVAEASTSMAPGLGSQAPTGAQPSSEAPVRHGLTGRELEVLRALATGASTAEVARELYVSPKTAKNHIAHIYAKLGVSSRTQAVAKALRQGIVNID
jgi:DNA-binding NarL/FixJ family response regulator